MSYLDLQSSNTYFEKYKVARDVVIIDFEESNVFVTLPIGSSVTMNKKTNEIVSMRIIDKDSFITVTFKFFGTKMIIGKNISLKIKNNKIVFLESKS